RIFGRPLARSTWTIRLAGIDIPDLQNLSLNSISPLDSSVNLDVGFMHVGPSGFGPIAEKEFSVRPCRRSQTPVLKYPVDPIHRAQRPRRSQRSRPSRAPRAHSLKKPLTPCRTR